MLISGTDILKVLCACFLKLIMIQNNFFTQIDLVCFILPELLEVL